MTNKNILSIKCNKFVILRDQMIFMQIIKNELYINN